MDDALHTVTARAQHPLHGAGLLGVVLCLMAMLILWPLCKRTEGPGPRPQLVLATGCTAVPLLDRCRALLPAALRELPPVDTYVDWRLHAQNFAPLDLPDPRPESPDAHWSPPSLPRPDRALHQDPVDHLYREVAIRDWSLPLPQPGPRLFAPQAGPALGALTDDADNIELYAHIARLQWDELDAIGRARRLWRDIVLQDEVRRRSAAMKRLWNAHDLRSSRTQLAWLHQSARHQTHTQVRLAASVTIPILGVLVLLLGSFTFHTRPRTIRVTAHTLSIDGRRFPLHDIRAEFWDDKRCPGVDLHGGHRLGLVGYRLPIETAWDLSDATRSGIRSAAGAKEQSRDRHAVQRLALAE